MAKNLRRFGVIGEDLPSKISQAVAGAAFNIAGLIGRFPGQFLETISIKRVDEAVIIFGERVISFFGFDALEGFFQNSGNAELFVKSHVGNDGSVVDAVVADADVSDQTNPMLKIKAGWKDKDKYGAVGNSTGYQIARGFRYETTLAQNALSIDTEIFLDAVSGIEVGDTMEFDLASLVSFDIIAVDEANKSVTLSAAVGVVGTAGETAKVMGFQIKTFQRSSKGVVTQVEKGLGAVFLSPNPQVVDFYFVNVHKKNQFLKLESLGSASLDGDKFPSLVTTTAFLAGGDDGTTPTISAHWEFNHAAFNNDPIRFIFNPETTLEAYFENLETYLFNRTKTDFPISLPTIPNNLDKQLLGEIGSRYQKSAARIMVNVGHFLEVADKFSSSASAPPREVPNVGHVCGAWITTIRSHGIHQVPGIFPIVLRGVTGVVEAEPKLDDQDRTDLAELGMNVIQNVKGEGVKIRNFFTPSTLEEFAHGNSILMRNFIRESIKDAQLPKVNEPNVFANVISGKNAIDIFMNNLFERGSTGRVPLGETFGQLFSDDGVTPQTYSELVEVIADPTNNNNLDLKAGERNYDTFFQVAIPTGSIKIGVGIKF